MADEQTMRALANQIALKRDSGDKYVLLLGAGASYGSGIPTTPTIMKELVDKYARTGDATGFEDRFDELWAKADESSRRQYLESYLKQEPSQGYLDLADLIGQGFFDTVVTFNFDALLEKGLSLQGIPATSYKVIIRGEVIDGNIQRLLEAKEPRIKILKMHGSLYSTDYFLFSKEETLNYPPGVDTLLTEVTARDIIVCGYAFADQCVSRAFSPKGGTVVCVNPSGPPTPLKGFIKARHSSDFTFSGESGHFDEFFARLRKALLEPSTEHRILRNPFKFLESYAENDAQDYLGREDELASTRALLERQDAVRALHILGRPRIGKTSFIRAGVLGHLDPHRFKKVYLRCCCGLESQLATELCRQAGIAVAGEDASGVLRDLAHSTEKRVVLVLDQFERVTCRFTEDDSQRQQFLKLLKAFHPADMANLSVVFVGVDDSAYTLQLLELAKTTPLEVVSLTRLDDSKLAWILGQQASRAELELDPQVIRDLVQRYNQSKQTNKPFSLAHIEAVCHLLGEKGRADWATYRGIDEAELAALDSAINRYDFVSFVEDFPSPQERILLLQIMKRVNAESKWKIAEFIKEHCAQRFLQVTAPSGSASPAHGTGQQAAITAEGGHD